MLLTQVRPPLDATANAREDYAVICRIYTHTHTAEMPNSACVGPPSDSDEELLSSLSQD